MNAIVPDAEVHRGILGQTSSQRPLETRDSGGLCYGSVLTPVEPVRVNWQGSQPSSSDPLGADCSRNAVVHVGNQEFVTRPSDPEVDHEADVGLQSAVSSDEDDALLVWPVRLPSVVTRRTGHTSSYRMHVRITRPCQRGPESRSPGRRDFPSAQPDTAVRGTVEASSWPPHSP